MGTYAEELVQFYEKGAKRIEMIRRLEAAGILGPEMCPTESYWHWPVIRPDDLNEELRAQYFTWGEVRWFGGPR